MSVKRAASDERFDRYLLMRAVEGALLVTSYLPAEGEYLLSIAERDTPLAHFLLVTDAASALAPALRSLTALVLGALPDALRACALALAPDWTDAGGAGNDVGANGDGDLDPLVRTSERTATVRLRCVDERPPFHKCSLQLLTPGNGSRTVTESHLNAAHDETSKQVWGMSQLFSV